MIIQVDLWQIIGIGVGWLFAFFSASFAAAKLLFLQFEKRQEERFAAQEASRREAQKHWDGKFSELAQSALEESRQWQHVERELMTLKADLPLNYVRREDYIRNQSVIEAKLDGLAIRIENALLKGDRNG